MIAFSDYINEKNWYSFDYFGNLLLEITEEEAEAIQVKDGKWSSDYSTFYFNVEGVQIHIALDSLDHYIKQLFTVTQMLSMVFLSLFLDAIELMMFVEVMVLKYLMR